MKKNLVSFAFLLFLLVLPICSRAETAENKSVFILDGTEYAVPYEFIDRTSAYLDENGEDSESEDELSALNETASLGSRYLNLDSKGAQDLIRISGCRFSWSSRGTSLIVFSCEDEIYADPEGQLKHKDGTCEKFSGSFALVGGRHLMTEELFLHLINFAEKNEKSEEFTELSHVINAPKFIRSDAGERIIFNVSSKPVYLSENSDSNTLVLTFKNSVWNGAEKIHEDCADIRAEQGEDLKVYIHSPGYWYPRIMRSLDPRELAVVQVMETGASFKKDSENSVSVSSVSLSKEAEASEGEAVSEKLEILSDAPYKYFWFYCRECGKLHIEILNADITDELLKLGVKSEYIEDLKAENVYSLGRKIGRIEMTLKPGCDLCAVSDKDTNLCTFKFFASENGVSDGSLYGMGSAGNFSSGRGTIVLDPGHGGGDPGCHSRWFGTYEKNITLDVALRLRDILEENGWNVVMTRETDTDVSWRGSPDKVELQSRCDAANDINADYFISLHCNASVSSSAYGSSVYWFKKEDKDLAYVFEDALADLNFSWIGCLREGFYVLRNTDMPAVLIEMAFLSNYYDGKKLSDPECRQRIAQCLADAVLSRLEH